MSLFSRNVPRALWALWKNGYLKEHGWFRSFCAGESVDGTGEPIPWFTYPAIAFLRERLSPDFSLFEFGCGNSTRFWSRNLKQVDVCEHQAAWAERIQSLCGGNTRIRCVAREEYPRAIAETGCRYEIVVIDGELRRECLEYTFPALTDNGVIVLDDSFREELQPIFDRCAEYGFRSLRFPGPTPIYNHLGETAIFYRSDNCFRI